MHNIYTHMWLAESASVHQGKYGGRMSTVDVLLEVWVDVIRPYGCIEEIDGMRLQDIVIAVYILCI
jgi:hypothetical protein